MRVNDTEIIETSMVLRSIGYQGVRLPNLPFDPTTGIVPNDRGRVVDDAGRIVDGVYVTGWIKRGPRGLIGTNRSCAQETVSLLLADFDAGTLDRQVAGRAALQEMMSERGVAPVDWTGWRAIDTAERERGSAASRPRVKFVAVQEMLSAARPSPV